MCGGMAGRDSLVKVASMHIQGDSQCVVGWMEGTHELKWLKCIFKEIRNVWWDGLKGLIN